MQSIWTRELGDPGLPTVVFAHGWARSHADFLPVAELLAPRARAVLIDLPGFGQSPRPEAAWTTSDYADCLRKHLAQDLGLTRYIWVGHSFGGRIGLRLGAMSDSPLAHLVIVGGAGVKRPVPPLKRWKSKWRSREFQRKKSTAQTEADVIALEREYGSADYVDSRRINMRDIFIQTVQEDQADSARRIGCQTTLLYGGKDTETPPEVGQILHRLIPNSSYLECPEFDHVSILSRGRHQIALAVLDALKEVAA